MESGRVGMFQNILSVGIGGFIGAIIRFLLIGWAERFFPTSILKGYVSGVLLVNTIGCFLMGVMIYLLSEQDYLPTSIRLFLVVGILGSLTTFSSFGEETFILLREGHHTMVFLNICGHLVIALGAVFLGYYVTTFFDKY